MEETLYAAPVWADGAPAGTAPAALASPEPGAPARAPLLRWLTQGLRASVLLRPRVGAAQPTPLQVLLLVVLLSMVEIGVGRLEINGPAVFDLRAWIAPWSNMAALLLAMWWALPKASGLASWFALWTVAMLPVNLVSQLLVVAQSRQALPAWLSQSEAGTWLVYGLLVAWMVAILLRLAGALGVRWLRWLVVASALVGLLVLTAWLFPEQPWQASAAAQGTEEAAEPETLQLSQQVFEAQQQLLQNQLNNLAAERPGLTDVYGLVFAPYAQEDVFLRESTMVAGVLAERFDAAGRMLHLVNHASTAETHPWATPQNLERAIDAIAGRMDRANDVLVIYLTSHGASNFKLAADHTPLQVEPISPGELRVALDKAGIKNRVIAVSACYSGGWVGPLASPDTLVMTAADATHTSYGCGRLSELTFFGRAVWNEQLRSTRSFEQAFAQAVPLIRQREIDAGKDDGFSNPQISVGEQIRPLLDALDKRLSASAQPAPEARR